MWSVPVKGSEVALWGDENVLELDGCRALWVDYELLNRTL